MAKNAFEDYISAARKEGYSDDEIRAHLSKSENPDAQAWLKANTPAQTTPITAPTPVAANPELPPKAEDFGSATDALLKTEPDKQAARVDAMRKDQPLNMPGWMRDLMLAGTGLAVGGAAVLGGYKYGKKKGGGAPPPPPPGGPSARVEPTLDVDAQIARPFETAQTAPTPQMGPGEEFYRRTQGTVASTPQDKAFLEKSYQAMLDKQAAAAAREAAIPPAAMPMAPVPPVAPSATPMAPAPAAPIPTTFAGATVAEPPVAAPTAPAQAAKPPAEKTKSTFKSAADIPSGYVFRPDVGNLDRGLFNILGPEHRLYAKELLNNGMPFGDAGPKDYNQRIAQITEQYWKAVQGQTPETILSREARTAQGVPHGEFGTYGSLGRKAKVAGVAGTLLSAAEAALAAQQGRYGEAAVRGMDVATDFIPGVAAAKQALAPQGVAPGTVPGNILDAAAKLGSPYYETEWARTQRMREAAGAGRGFVNPPLVR